MFDPRQSERFESLLNGKRVVVVGPSRSIIGSNQGEVIEGFDLVVRINHQWPVPEDRVADLGRRMDVLYHCCNGDFPISRLFRAEFRETKFVCYEEGPDHPSLVAHCESEKIVAMNVTKQYRALFASLKSYPNTGLVAITHLLQARVSELYLTGFSFFREAYYEGYLATANKSELWEAGNYPKNLWRHDTDAQLNYFKRVPARDPRVKIDAKLQELLS